MTNKQKVASLNKLFVMAEQLRMSINIYNPCFCTNKICINSIFSSKKHQIRSIIKIRSDKNVKSA